MSENEISAKEFNCKKCKAVDNDRMVQCDKCDQWYHYDCVAVNSGVADESWSCEMCHIRSDEASGGNKTPMTDNMAYSMGLLRQPQAASSPTITGETQQRASKTSTETVNRNLLPPNTDVNAPAHILQNNRTMRISYSTREPAKTITSTAPTSSLSFPFNKNIQKPSANQQNTTFSPHVDLQLKFLEEQQRLQQDFLERKYKILSQMDESAQFQQNPFNVSNNLNFMVGPTSSQLAARQAIPRDLPNFNGDPDDWPLFISSFETSTSVAGYSNAENLIRLQSCLKGRAKELVKSKLMLPTMVPEIIHTLRMCFGRPEHILERVIEKARKLPQPRDKLESMIEFALCVKNIYSTMESCKMEAHMNNPLLVKELLDKLSSQYKLNWAMYPKDDCVPIIKTFSDWIFQIADAASTVVSIPPTIKNVNVNTHTEEQPPFKIKCCLCSSEHKISTCSDFKNLPLDKKWNIVKKNNLCRTCLNRHKGKCFSKRQCGIEGCTIKHHKLLHKYLDEPSPSTSQQNSSSERNNTTSGTINSHSSTDYNQKNIFRILPIRLQKKNGYINTYAFLDEGSSVSLIDKGIFDLLDIDGVKRSLCLKWTGNTTRLENSSLESSIVVSGMNNDRKFTLQQVHTVENLGLPQQTLNMKDLVSKYPYLNGLPIQSYKNAAPGILIGLNNWSVAVPLMIREGQWGQPIAIKTRLGWTIQGCSGKTKEFGWINIHNCECERNYNKLHKLVKDSFNLEEPMRKSVISEEDKKAMEILRTTCQKVNGRYEVGLLWKKEIHILPESYNNAYKRLMCLNKKMERDPNLKNFLQDKINNLLSKGYAKKLNEVEINKMPQPVWYLPIFITTNPNKPGKVRLVWDAAAKSNGISLNDYINSGPDLLKSLFDVLMSFRVGKVAVCGDIEEMFHQINVRKSDMHSQRFLWWDENDDVYKPSIYVMRALIFGISCAPCIAHYVRDINAEEFKEKFPRAVEAIQHHHYVDDFIDSVDSIQEAIDLASQVKFIHAAAGFNIRSWSSNSSKVTRHLQECRFQDQKPKELADTEKILGMYWDPNKDSFVYIFRFARLRREVLSDEIIPTKRELLQVLMSIFDPLGLISCYTTTLKILLQEVWRSGIEWDADLPDSLLVKWQKWKVAISHIAAVNITRCYSLHLNEATHIELHTFTDAGEYAYAAVCYIRVVYQGNYDVSILAAKSKVAPLKPISIPRLELQAAVMGVKLAKKIAEMRRIKFTSKYFWSDSKTVLQWLRMDPKRFQQFVMHRVGEILESTEAKHWRWVPSKINPADLATKVQAVWEFPMWFKGPKFLREDESSWPLCNSFDECSQEEIRHHLLLINKGEEQLPLNCEYFSDWRRLYRAIATFILYLSKLKAHCKGHKPPEELTFVMIKQAKSALFREAQWSEFYNEICCLKKDDDGILRARGRTSFLNHEDVIVLPTNHHVAFLLVRHTHEIFHHMSHETVINNIRSLFYIPKLRVLFKKVRKSCQMCKNTTAAPIMPQMSTLPPARLASFERPFTFVGIDYFGPLYVTVGRRKEKRWGVLFTCLTLRAVHLEIAYSLDTSSCVMSINNFMARRGVPREIYTDNGTNFKAASKIFTTNVDHETISKEFDNIRWKFNPPAAPHMGGSWERLVRSVKTALYHICPHMNFNDETLKSAMAEVEFIINSRPLTFVSLESCDDEALTPNHLLLGSSNGLKPINYKELDLRQRWTNIKLFADKFWHRWVKEYAPTLIKRPKWHEKATPLQVGDIVVIIDENLPRHCWPKGKIIEALMAKDGQVRQATVRTQCGVLQRPTAKLAKLDVGNNIE